MNRMLVAAALAVATGLVAPVNGQVPGVRGTIYKDLDLSGAPSQDELLAGVAVQLYMDDGDGQFGAGDTQIGTDFYTGLDGKYNFDNLIAGQNYYVRQIEQTVGGLSLAESVSGVLVPGQTNLLIDNFDNNQRVKANPYTPIATSTTSDPSAQILGVERDMYVQLMTGIGEVAMRSLDFGDDVLQFDNSAGVTGMGYVTWDGNDMNASPIPSLGLGDIDLTENGKSEGIYLKMGIDSTGEGDAMRLRIFDEDSSVYSEAAVPFPVTDGTAMVSVYVPFTDLVGVVSPEKVNAIQLIFGDDTPSVDAQIDMIGTVGSVEHDFVVVPEPSGLVLSLLGLMALVARRRR